LVPVLPNFSSFSPLRVKMLSRSADFPFALSPLRTYCFGADVSINQLLQADCSIHPVPPDPSNLSLRLFPCFLLADSSFNASDDFLSIYKTLSGNAPVESETLVIAFARQSPSFLVLWGFIRLPLILSGLSTWFPSILVLKHRLLRALLHHLFFSNLSQDFLLIVKSLRTYRSGFWLRKDSICISSFSNLVLPDLRLPHLAQNLSVLISIDSDTFFVPPERLTPFVPGFV